MAASYCVVLITVPDAQTGERLATELLERKLAACVNRIGGVCSKYWWEGKIESAEEHLLLVKTRSALLKKLAACVKEKHPYSVPEVIALPVAGGHRPYLDWVKASTC